MNAFRFPFLVLLLSLAGCPLGGSGGGGDDLVCDDGMGNRLDCPADPDVHRLTGVQALQAMQASFQDPFPGAVWMGGIAGVYIGRDGKSKDQGPVINAGGFQLENASGWTGNFCVDQPTQEADDQLNFDTSNGKCTALRTCLAVNCNAVTPAAFPAVDTPAAIEAAFPGDPADTFYSVQLVTALGNYWQITRAAIGNQVAESRKVDTQTGALIP